MSRPDRKARDENVPVVRPERATGRGGVDLELARAVHEACPDCAIVVVSGWAVPTASELAERARYIPKPFVGQEIVRLVEGLLAA